MGLSQSKLEMVPNGNFSQFDNYDIPFSVWKQKYAGDVVWRDKNIFVKDIYGFDYMGVGGIRGAIGYLKEINTVFNLTSWYPIRHSQKLNFDSIIYQDTFHFFNSNQYENVYASYEGVTFNIKTGATKIRVCGKNLYQIGAPLRFKTRKGAFYNLNLDLMYDKNTYYYTLIFKKRIRSATGDFNKDFPFMQNPRELANPSQTDIWWFYLTKCNITLDTNLFSRNNNLKITLMNQFFNDSSNSTGIIKEQDVWNMPLFPEIDNERHFSHSFKANDNLSWLQLRQKHQDSVQYYANDTLPFPRDVDSLFRIITHNGIYSTMKLEHGAQYRFHPALGHWKWLKQWQYPGKYRRYADKALRNADYFIDNLSLQPEMYQKGSVAAPSILCEADTFLAFIPSGMPAIWTDLISGKILSNGDSCWISLTDTVSIEVRNNQFVDTLNYTLRQPKSPFTKDSYSLCLGDSLVFSAEAGYGIQWQKGQSSSQRYVHRYADSSNIQATLTSPLGCEYKFTTSVIKGPSINQYSLDTFLCDKPLITLDIPGVSWVSLPVSGITQGKQQLNIATVADLKKNVMFTDTLTGCSVSLAINIRSNQSPNLGEDIDTVICPDNQLVIKLPTAEFHWLNGVKSTDLLNLKAAGHYSVIATNRTCADTLDIHLLKFSQIQVSVNQLNPWTCFLDSAMLFVASPNKYQYYWPGSSAATNTHTTQDTGLLHLLVKDTNDCELNLQIKPKYSCNKPVWIPNVFTPNGTTLNETFGPHCISCKTIYIQIYSRWGECIYKGSEPWDGTYRGEPVPNGTYAYKIGVELWFGSTLRNSFFYGDVQVLR